MKVKINHTKFQKNGAKKTLPNQSHHSKLALFPFHKLGPRCQIYYKPKILSGLEAYLLMCFSRKMDLTTRRYLILRTSVQVPLTSVQVPQFRYLCLGASIQIPLFRYLNSGSSAQVSQFRYICLGNSIQVPLFRYFNGNDIPPTIELESYISELNFVMSKGHTNQNYHPKISSL